MKIDTPLNPPTAIGYVRVSTEEQATEGVSLEAQRAKDVAYCGLHGLALAQTYADEGLSGKRADIRIAELDAEPAVRKLLDPVSNALQPSVKLEIKFISNVVP